MEFNEIRNEINKLNDEMVQIEIDYKRFNKEYTVLGKKIRLCESRKKDISNRVKELENIISAEEIYGNVLCIEGCELLSQNELVIITNGMDKTDYRSYSDRKYGDCPRWFDLERLVKEVSEFKKLYKGYILEKIIKSGKYDTLPPDNFYKFTYKTPYGHYLTYDKLEVF